MPTDFQYAYAPYAYLSRSSLPIPDITDPDPVINYPTFTLCSAATLTDTRSSDISGLRHNLEYISCSSTCTFVNWARWIRIEYLIVRMIRLSGSEWLEYVDRNIQ